MNEIDDYIRANRERYTREALTGKLRDAGHDPADIEAAWERVGGAVGGEDAAPTASGTTRGTRGRPGIGTFLLVLLVFAGYASVGYLGVAGILFSAYYGGGEPGAPVGSVVPTALVAVYVIAMVAGFVYAGARLLRAPSVSEGASAIATAFGVSVALLFGINGACIAGVLAASAVGALR